MKQIERRDYVGQIREKTGENIIWNDESYFCLFNGAGRIWVWKQPKERFNIITQWLTVYVLAKVYFLYEQFLMFDLSFLVGYCTLLGNTEKFLPHTIQNANVQMVWGTP